MLLDRAETRDYPSAFRALNRAKEFLGQVTAGGGTNLASALATAIGLSAPEDWFLRYLIVTDGLSETREDDLALSS
jgi:uncharacterized protein with von Willebrand factor type A (vWA) domain